MLSVNFVVELPESSGHDAVMTAVDSVSKRVYFIQHTQRSQQKKWPDFFFTTSGSSMASQSVLSWTADLNS